MATSLAPLTETDVTDYRLEGYLLLPELLPTSVVEALRAAAERDLATDSPRRVVEADGETVRAVHGGHMVDPILSAICRHEVLLTAARQLIGADAYVHQFKINAKRARRGDVWEWHQDFVFWREEDGMPEPRATNVAIFLDEAADDNGPILLVPGSHRDPVVDTRRKDDAPSGYGGQPDWVGNLTASLRYTVDEEVVDDLHERHGVVAGTGPPGTVLFFHPEVVHGSAGNESERDRVVLIVTYNAVDNAPRPVAKPRPEFLCARDTRPLEPLPWEEVAGAATRA
jgi:ectoine hydroxylase